MCLGGIFHLLDSSNQDRSSCLNNVSDPLSWVSCQGRRPSLMDHRHCIVGGVIGVGIAALGADGVVWGWSGVSQVFAAWVIAPCLAGAFAAMIFLVTKYGVLKRKDPFRAGLFIIPVYFAITSGILTMLIVWKGGKRPTNSDRAPQRCADILIQLRHSNWTTGPLGECWAASLESPSVLHFFASCSSFRTYSES